MDMGKGAKLGEGRYDERCVGMGWGDEDGCGGRGKTGNDVNFRRRDEGSSYKVCVY